MTIAQMATLFDLLQDKYGSPYFTNSEKTVFFNRAHVAFVRELLFPEEGDENSKQVNIEYSQDTISAVAPLIFTLPAISMNSSGYITKASIQTSLNAMQNGAIVWRPLSIGLVSGGDKHPVSYVRHNDWWKFQENYFKVPTLDNPKCKETITEYQFLPVNLTAQIYFDILKYPLVVDIDGGISSDLPDFTHDTIVAIALSMAGVCSRDQALLELKQALPK